MISSCSTRECFSLFILPIGYKTVLPESVEQARDVEEFKRLIRNYYY